MTRDQYKAKIKELESIVAAAVEDKKYQTEKIKELENKIVNQQKELNVMLNLWSQVVSHKKDEPAQSGYKIFGGGFAK